MSQRRSYTAEQRVEARVAYEEHGPREAERRTGIPHGTITKWAKAESWEPRFLENADNAAKAQHVKWELRRAELRTRLLDKAHDALDRMDDEHIDFKGKDAIEVTYPKPSAQGFQAYATAAAILLDKFRLEMGEATARTEHDHFEPLDRELAKLAAEVKAKA